MIQATSHLHGAGAASATRPRLQFGIMIFPDAPAPILADRFRQAEVLGFDQVVVPDHIGDLRDLSGFWLEGWSVLAAAAVQTERIRIGPLVANPILRPPAMLAKQAMAIDHLSGGRLDLGIGAGIFDFDHVAVGTEPWSPKERAGRFAEYVEIVDGILRGTGERYSFAGQWLQAGEVPTAPGSLQRPRPPIVVGGQSPTVLRVTAARADVWNTIGPIGADLATVLEVTARQNRQLDALCEANGRDPATLRRSLAVYGATDPWEAPVSLEEIVERFMAIGIHEYVIGWPPEDRLDDFRRLTDEVIQALRAR